MRVLERINILKGDIMAHLIKPETIERIKAKSAKRKANVRSITIIARRWLHRPYGNHYSTSSILINGEFVHCTEKDSGYSMYEQNAKQWLIDNGYLPDMDPRTDTLWNYCQRKGIAYSATVCDITREKDL